MILIGITTSLNSLAASETITFLSNFMQCVEMAGLILVFIAKHAADT